MESEKKMFEKENEKLVIWIY